MDLLVELLKESGVDGNITWFVDLDNDNDGIKDEEGTLTISGEGAMNNYSNASPAPWEDRFFSVITSVVINPGVTSIGNHAFSSLIFLKSAMIPKGVTSIGEYAFRGDDELTSVTIPEGVTEIQKYAFSGCDGLKTVTIPYSVSSIGASAFSGCTGITDIYYYVAEPATITANSFSSVPTTAKIHVPLSSYNIFEAADGWNNFQIASELFKTKTTAESEATCVDLVSGTVTLTDGGYSLESTFVEPLEYDGIEASVNYVRNYSVTDWQALYVPFDIPVTATLLEQFDFARINDTHQYDDNGDGIIDRTTIESIVVKTGTLKANTPYLVRAHATGEQTMNVPSTTIYTTEECTIDCSTTDLLFTFTGIYTRRTAAELNGCYAWSSLGNSLVQAEGDYVTLSPYRFYMDIRNREDDQQACLSITLRIIGDEGTTDIELIRQNDVNATEGEVLYDLSGRQITNPAEGIYIKNGKKYIQK